jgi:hypothetical protein
VHQGLDYTQICYFLDFCAFGAVGFSYWHPKYRYGCLKQWWNPNSLWIRRIPSYCIWDQHTWDGGGTILVHFLSIIYIVPHPIPSHPTTNMANVPSIIGVFLPYAYMKGIWVFKPWPNPFLWSCGSLFLNATFGLGNTTWGRYHLKYNISNMYILRNFLYIIILFPVPSHHQYGKYSKYCWCVFIIYIYERYPGVQTMTQFLFLKLW